MSKKLMSLAVIAMMLAGCSQNDLIEGTQNPDNAIGFGVYTTQTKGLVLGDEDVKDGSNITTNGIKTTGFGILAAYTKEKDFDGLALSTSDKPIMNFMWNQEVKWNDAVGSKFWYYSPLKYWPNTTGENISFFAYAPYEANPTAANTTGTGIELTTNIATGYPAITYTLKENPLNLGDLVYAMKIDEKKPALLNEKNVLFTFNHALTRVDMKAYVDNTINDAANSVSDGTTTFVYITHVDLLGTDDYEAPSKHELEDVDGNASSKLYSAATFNFNKGVENKLVNWTNPQKQEGEYSLGNADDTKSILPLIVNNEVNNSQEADDKYTTKGVRILQTTEDTYTSLFKSNQYLFLIPPGTTVGTADAGIGTLGDIKVAITYDIVTLDSKLKKGYSITTTTATLSLPVGTLKMGKAYSYIFKIGIAGITVDATVTEWGTEENVYMPSVSVNINDILSGLATLNANRGTATYFVVNVLAGASGEIDLSTLTGFATGNKIDLRFEETGTPGVTVKLPATGWSQSGTITAGAAGTITLTKN